MENVYSFDELLKITGAKKRPASALAQLAAAVSRRARTGDAGTKIRVVGIDPGTRVVGWGVIDCGFGRASELVACGCIKADPELPLCYRLRDIFAELEAVLSKHKPQAAVIEETFAGVNMKSAIAMGEGRGIALLALSRAGLEIHERSPRSIKQAVTGSGAASKARVAAMVAAQLGLKKAPKPADVTDALAAAISLANRAI